MSLSFYLLLCQVRLSPHCSYLKQHIAPPGFMGTTLIGTAFIVLCGLVARIATQVVIGLVTRLPVLIL